MPKMEKKYKLTNRRYLGSKTKLLSFIHETVEKENISFDSLLDLFAGTGSVADSYNDGKHRIILNDILECNRCAFNAFFGNERIDEPKLKAIIEKYNSANVLKENYFSKN